MGILFPDGQDSVDFPHTSDLWNGYEAWSMGSDGRTVMYSLRVATQVTQNGDNFHWENQNEGGGAIMSARYHWATTLEHIIIIIGGENLAGTPGTDYGYAYYSVTLTVGTTYHLAFVFRSEDTPLLYIDGVSTAWTDESLWTEGAVNQAEFNHVNPNGVIELGAGDGGGTPQGAMENFMFWTTELTEAQINMCMVNPYWACGQSGCAIFLPLTNVPGSGAAPPNRGADVIAPTLYHTPTYGQTIAPVMYPDSPLYLPTKYSAGAGALTINVSDSIGQSEALD